MGPSWVHPHVAMVNTAGLELKCGVHWTGLIWDMCWEEGGDTFIVEDEDSVLHFRLFVLLGPLHHRM